MKKLFIVIIVLLINSANAQDFQNPNVYLTYLGKETDRLTQSLWQYTSAIAHSRNLNILNEKRLKLLEDSKLVNQKVLDLKNGYKGDVVYRNQLLEYLALMDKQINSEFDKIYELENGTIKSFEEVEKYTLNRNVENQKIKNLVEELNQNQKVFADKYDIRITENKSDVSEKMKISNEVFNYHSKFYLLFLRTNMAESNLIDAIAKKDLLLTQKNADILSKLNADNFDKLKTFDSYNNDATLFDKSIAFFEFIKKEVDEFVPSVIIFLHKKNNFDAIKSEIDLKKLPTSDDQELYNNAVKEKNMSFKNYMRINDYYNAEREIIIKNWNLEGDKFIDKHIPLN